MKTHNERLIARYTDINELLISLNNKISLLVILRRHPTSDRLQEVKMECDSLVLEIKSAITSLYNEKPSADQLLMDIFE